MKNILVTGGAGFIGSNLVDALIEAEQIGQVRVLDDLSTGFLENISRHFGNPKFEFLQGDIRDFRTCQQACEGMHWVSHHAALGSVPRSLADPLATNAVNITGMLNVLQAAKEARVQRLVFAGSSSTYGDSPALPKVEERIGKPLSPYAVTKYVNELYASVFARSFDMEVIGLRYFNVFGPRQSPRGAYAAAIPLFIHQLMRGERPTLHGDGSQSRDFTFIENVVQANLMAFNSTHTDLSGEVFNIAYGQQTTLLELFESLSDLLGLTVEPIFGPERKGDVKHSLASIEKAQKMLGYVPKISVIQGLRTTVAWHQQQASRTEHSGLTSIEHETQVPT